MEQYDIDYFLAKFEAIPEDKIIMNFYTDNNDETKHCSLGHCEGHNNPIDRPSEAKALRDLFKVHLKCGVADVNDNLCEHKFNNLPTPKQRIMAALNEIKILTCK